jgi:3-hydroxybutyrate dehydrogenase
VLTPLVERQLADRAKQTGRSMDETKEEFLREKQPMLAFSTPESIGALTVFLCGDAAATITGSAYSIDGGWVAQ